MPSPTTSCARNVTCLATSCVRSARRRARLRRNPRKLATSRRRIGFVFLQPAHSPPAASHPVSKRRDDPAPRTTQLLSAICAAATHGTDSHRTDQRTDGRTRGGFQTRPYSLTLRAHRNTAAPFIGRPPRPCTRTVFPDSAGRRRFRPPRSPRGRLPARAHAPWDCSRSIQA